MTDLTFDEFSRRLCGSFGLATVGISTNTSLWDDLGLDSVQAMQVLLSIEEWAEVLLPPEEIPALMTLGDAYDYYRSLDPGIQSNGK